jgi:hypothetical protein
MTPEQLIFGRLGRLYLPFRSTVLAIPLMTYVSQPDSATKAVPADLVPHLSLDDRNVLLTFSLAGARVKRKSFS